MAFEFRSTFHATAADMHRAIAVAYLQDSGGCDDFEQKKFLANHSPEDCADEAIYQWLLDEPAWADPRGFSRLSLIAAYAALRHSRAPI